MICPKCDQNLVMTTIESMQSNEGDFGVIVLKMPILWCCQCGRKQYVYADFGSDFIDYIFKQIMITSQKDTCKKCSHDISMVQDANEKLNLPIHIKGTFPFNMEIHGRLRRCPQCQTLQFLGGKNTEFLIPELLMESFKQTNIQV